MDANFIKTKFFKDRNSWRRWLSKNNKKADHIWILFFKVNTQKNCLRYSEAVEEALCFGWIDGILKRIDDQTHMQRFTPRKPGSIWSKINKERALKMIDEGKMTQAGMTKISEAKKNGWWKKAYTTNSDYSIPPALNQALRKDKKALKLFEKMPKGYRNRYIFWINLAKREATKQNRINIFLERLKENKKPGWFD
jgi:uncharacterized protein YdeI (YjbR/CyaY-like superfamily)